MRALRKMAVGVVGNLLVLPAAAATGLVAASMVTTAASAAPSLPPSEIKVCRIFRQAMIDFAPLQQDWKVAEADKNGASRQIAEDQLKTKIDALFETRNQRVLNILSTRSVKDWIANLSNIRPC